MSPRPEEIAMAAESRIRAEAKDMTDVVAKLAEATSRREFFEAEIKKHLAPGFFEDYLPLYAMWFAQEERNTAELARLAGS